MKQEKMYKIAIRSKETYSDSFWEHENFHFSECNINCKGRYWLADPFVFEKNGITYLFYEAFDLVEKRGKIGYSIYSEDGSCTTPRIVIDEPFHMSFPNIFECNGEIYIMPETCGDWRVKLYKASSFPNIWEPADILLPDVFACDSILIEEKNRQWLLACEMYHHPPVDSYSSCWVKNVLYPMNGRAVIGEGVKVCEGDYGIRNAGKSFVKEGKLYRVGQDCRYKQYGRGLALFEIESLNPYREKMQWNKDYDELSSHIVCSNKNDIIGVHTYNSSEHYEIVDFSFFSNLSFITYLKRKFYPIKRHLLLAFNR